MHQERWSRDETTSHYSAMFPDTYTTSSSQFLVVRLYDGQMRWISHDFTGGGTMSNHVQVLIFSGALNTKYNKKNRKSKEKIN